MNPSKNNFGLENLETACNATYGKISPRSKEMGNVMLHNNEVNILILGDYSIGQIT